jgi:hypothetical protein
MENRDRTHNERDRIDRRPGEEGGGGMDPRRTREQEENDRKQRQNQRPNERPNPPPKTA